MQKNIARILPIFLLAGTIFFGTSVVLADDATTTATPVAAPTGISIVSPTQGQSFVQSSIQISGTAPAGVIVAVIINDTDTNQPLVEHQAFSKVQGSVTSDQNGHWIYTPQEEIVPGNFSVQATYNTADNQTMSSATVQFVVTTNGGSSHILSQATIRRLWIGAGILLLLIISFIIHRYRQRRGLHWRATGHRPKDIERPAREHEPEESTGTEQAVPLFMSTSAGRQYVHQQEEKMQELKDETAEIEQVLSLTAEELERANERVASLRQHITESDVAPPEEHGKTDLPTNNKVSKTHKG